MISKYEGMELNFWWSSFEDFQKDRIRIGGRLDAIERGDITPEPEVIEEMNRLFNLMKEGEELCSKYGSKAVERQQMWSYWMVGVKGLAGRLVGPLLAGITCSSRCRSKNGQWERKLPQKKRWAVCKYGKWCKGDREIRRFKHLSNLWSYSGLSPSQKRKRGEKAGWNRRLRRQTWLIAKQFVRTKDSAYRKLYETLKGNLTTRRKTQGYEIIPSDELPKNDVGKKYEPEGVMSEGHLEGDVLRRLRKIFMSHVFDIWRYIDGLPEEPRYAERFDISEDYIPPLVDDLSKLKDKSFYTAKLIKKPEEVF